MNKFLSKILLTYLAFFVFYFLTSFLALYSILNYHNYLIIPDFGEIIGSTLDIIGILKISLIRAILLFVGFTPLILFTFLSYFYSFKSRWVPSLWYLFFVPATLLFSFFSASSLLFGLQLGVFGWGMSIYIFLALFIIELILIIYFKNRGHNYFNK